MNFIPSLHEIRFARYTEPQNEISIVWFRDDLRLTDNEALAAAAEHGKVLGIYILEAPSLTGVRPLGGASKWWLHNSLKSLATQLSKHNIPLLLAHGDPRTLRPQITREAKAKYVSWSRRYSQPQRSIDEEVKTALRAQDAEAHSFDGHLLFEPWKISTNQGGAYKIFTPFSKRLKALIEESNERQPGISSYAQAALCGPGALLERSHAGIDGLGLLPSPSAAHWTGGLEKVWAPGEDGALKKLEQFIESRPAMSPQEGYAAGRDFPSLSATSGLSAHLRFGEVSPRYVWNAVSLSPMSPEDRRSFLNELMWRDFAWHRLYYRPDLATVNVRREFDMFDWLWDSEDSASWYAEGYFDPRHSPLSRIVEKRLGAEEASNFHMSLQAWRSGKTGIPLVDAGMRELWETGHMHNRIRMVVASFLTKNLGIHWRHGEEWFWETLVDADPASNAFNWQWAAGSGDDASPYFRIFNPISQAKRYDPVNAYIKSWVPEVGSAHYPKPIVDLKESRNAALEAYDEVKALRNQHKNL